MDHTGPYWLRVMLQSKVMPRVLSLTWTTMVPTDLVWWPSGLSCWFMSSVSWAHISPGSYPGCFMSSFHLYISFHSRLWGGLRAFRNPLPYNMYLFNLWIANHIHDINKELLFFLIRMMLHTWIVTIDHNGLYWLKVILQFLSIIMNHSVIYCLRRDYSPR